MHGSERQAGRTSLGICWLRSFRRGNAVGTCAHEEYGVGGKFRGQEIWDVLMSFLGLDLFGGFESEMANIARSRLDPYIEKSRDLEPR